jgi:hypothetical protein
MGLTIVLGAACLLFHFEWPLPDWGRRELDRRLREFSVDLRYKDACFDFLGNIRLADVQGHYQGLLEFSARQMLIRLLPSRGPEVVVDSGVLHTGFLRLPIPENIQFSGTVQKRSDGIFFRDTRFRANSLIMLVHGTYPLGHTPAKGGSSMTALLPENSQVGKVVAGLLTRLCSDKSLWVAQLELSDALRHLTLAGESFHVGDYQIIAPVISVEAKHSWMSASADEVDFPYGRAMNVAASYSVPENHLWRVIAGDIDAGGIHTAASSFTAHMPLGGQAGPKTLHDVSGAVNFQGNARAFFSGGRIVPLSTKIWGELPPDILQTFNLSLTFQKNSFFSGSVSDQKLLFDLLGSRGAFYDLSFDDLETRGTLGKSSVWVDCFRIVSGNSVAKGSLNYDFASRSADYRIMGEVDPMSIPWFGKWWYDFFVPFGGIRPFVALSMHTHPKEPAQALGIAAADDHHYRDIPVDHTRATFQSCAGGVKVEFASRSGPENLKAALTLGRNVSGSFSGTVYPKTLLVAFSREVPPALKELKFGAPPKMEGELSQNAAYCATLESSGAADFYTLHFNDLSFALHGDKNMTSVDSVKFDFAGGSGGGSAQVNSAGEGYGTFWLRNARLGEWALLGPLSQMLQTHWFSFATLKFHSADGSLVFSPSRVDVPSVNLWGDEHAAAASGYIDTSRQRLDFSVRLRSFGGPKQNFGILMAPLVQPITSVLEARLSGPVQSPKWSVQLAAPNL